LLPLEGMRGTAAVAREAGLRIHLDGARLWNASIASGIPEARYAEVADTVSVCLSKGMGCPVGSVLAADAMTIDRARHVRKRLGGGMRQVGLLASAGLYALDHHRERLHEDHRRARVLAAGLAPIPELRVDPEAIETNIVIIEVLRGIQQEWTDDLAAAGVLVVPFGRTSVRAVTHLDVDDQGITRAIRAFEDVAERRRGG
jgi:threonine aldolase